MARNDLHEDDAAEVPGGTATIATTTHGASYQAVYTTRQVKIYATNESDLENLSMLSHITTGAVSIASAAVGFIASIWWDVTTAGDQATRNIGDPIIKVLVVVVLACGVVGWLASRKKKGRLQDIMSESRVITPSGQ